MYVATLFLNIVLCPVKHMSYVYVKASFSVSHQFIMVRGSDEYNECDGYFPVAENNDTGGDNGEC